MGLNTAKAVFFFFCFVFFFYFWDINHDEIQVKQLFLPRTRKQNSCQELYLHPSQPTPTSTKKKKKKKKRRNEQFAINTIFEPAHEIMVLITQATSDAVRTHEVWIWLVGCVEA